MVAAQFLFLFLFLGGRGARRRARFPVEEFHRGRGGQSAVIEDIQSAFRSLLFRRAPRPVADRRIAP